MKILIHACPKRLWYVEDFLIPNLLDQGADSVAIWNDETGLGNLAACMESFRQIRGHGGTWHLQDDVLPCRDFVARCREYESDGVVYGFTCGAFGDDLSQTGRVYAPDVWHSFQCIRIPDEYARECAEWYFSGAWKADADPDLFALKDLNQGDDSFFRAFLQTRHGRERFTNVAPNLVDHVDWLIGGSVLSPWRAFVARSALWDDHGELEDLKREIRRPQGA